MGIKQIIRFFCLAILLFTASIAEAQNAVAKSNRIEVISGKRFYMHKVEKGQTLYSIGKAYGITANEVVVENPDLIDGLKPGQVIRIPVKEEIKKDPFFFKGPFHVVKKGDTMYSLSKLYNTTPEVLLNLNPELKDGGLKLGQILKLPDTATNGQFAETVKKDTVVMPVKIVEKDTSDLKVAFLLPLFTSLNQEEKEYKNLYEQQVICPKSTIGVSFYQGAMMAVDSLRKLGFSGTIYTYDSENDSSIIESIIKKPELKEMDLIVGPLYTSNFKRVSDFAKANKIPLVTPFSQVSRILLGNPYIYKATASLVTQIEELANYLNEKGTDKSIVLLTSDNPKDKALTEVFKKRYNCIPHKDTLREVSIKKSGTAALDKILLTGKEVWAVALSNDQVYVTELLNKLYAMKADNLKLFGLESWSTFENLEPDHLMKLHVSLTMPQVADYESDRMKQFIRSYRLKFHTDPDRYSLHAFDVTYYFLTRLKEQGRNFAEMESVKMQGLQTGFSFEKTAVESGYENKFTNIVEYKDYRLEKIN